MKRLLPARPAQIMLVYVRVPDFRMPIIIPLPLFAIEDLIESVATIAQFSSYLPFAHFGDWDQHLPEKFRSRRFRNRLIDLAVVLFRTLRRTGPLDMVDVEADGVKVLVKMV
jgi:hypothetical protein